MAENTKNLLAEVTNYLSNNDIDTWVFGGWAEEINGVIDPRSHKDIDLFYFDSNFEVVDKFLISENLPEIKGKHFRHKRAFEYNNVMVELFLVERDALGNYTNFWGKNKYYWPSDITGEVDGFNVILPKVLETYRRDYQQIHNLQIELQ